MYPTKEHLGSKWWHRLTKVLIGLTIIVSFVSSVVLVIIFPEKNKFILSTEQGYSERIGEEKNIKDVRLVLKDDVLVRAKDTSSTIRKYVEDLRKNGDGVYGVYLRAKTYNLVADTFSDLRVKEWQEFDYSSLWWLLLTPITYFILWLFYYEIILYIVYGKKRQSGEEKT